MNQINRVRVLVGGLVGGVVIFLIMGAINHLFLNNDWMQWMNSMGAMYPHPPTRQSMLLWLMESLVIGVTGTAVYAGVRPRYGAGSRTALWSGFLVWVLSYCTAMMDAKALGFLPPRIICGEWLGGLVASLVGVYIGAAIYKE